MDKDEALRLALEALQFALHVGFDESSESQIKKGEKAYQQHRVAIAAIKAALAQPAQRPWVEPRGDEWFNWWRVSKIADATEAEIDFADFITIALAVSAKLKEKNNG